MRVLVTGADGYIGTMLTPALIERGHTVVGLDIGYYRDGLLYDDGRHRPPVITKDIRDVAADDVAGFDAVVHLAELSNDPLAQYDPRLTYAINHRGSVALARSCRDAGVARFVYASSCSVYGAAADDAFCTETSTPAPQTAYAVCKALVERDVQALASERFSPVFLRNATAYGPSPSMRFDIVLNDLAGHAWTSGEVKVKTDGSPWRPLVHVEDIGQAIWRTLEAPRETIHNQILNVGDDAQNYTVSAIAEIVTQCFPGAGISFGTDGGDSRSYRVSFAKIRRYLPDFACCHTAADGAQQLYNVFAAIGMSTPRFAFRAFTRLKQLQHLRAAGAIDANLRWHQDQSCQFPRARSPHQPR
jgi:nucleoside-diphosphate-sugar epimerase